MTYMWRSRSAWDARASISDFSSFCTKIQIQIQSKGLRHVTIQSHYLHDVPLFKTSVQQWHVTEVIQRFGWSVAGLCTSSRNQWTQQTHNMIIKHCSVSLSDLHPHSRRFKTKGKKCRNIPICNNQWETTSSEEDVSDWLWSVTGPSSTQILCGAPILQDQNAKTANHPQNLNLNSVHHFKTRGQEEGKRAWKTSPNPSLALGVKYKPFGHVLFWLHLKNINWSQERK